MKNFMMKVMIAVFVVGSSLLTGCATPRTKWTDPSMKVMISPEGIGAAHHAKIQSALFQSGKFVVVDRASGFEAIKKEQELEHREGLDRFVDREKLARWGKLHGVGGVVIAHAECVTKDGWLKHSYNWCHQYIAILDTASGEVIAVAEGDAESDAYTYNLSPSWEDVVNKLVSNYPSHFEPVKEEKILREYKDVVQEEAVRQKEEVARKLAAEKQ